MPTYPSVTYYVDAHLNTVPGTPDDPDAQWANDANAFNGNTTDSASGNASGSNVSNYLYGKGTTAPTTPTTTISGVTARFYGNPKSAGQTNAAEIYTASKGTLLGTASGNTVVSAAWGAFITLTAPASGWTWAILNALEAVIYGGGGITPGANAYRVEIVVSIDHSTPGNQGAVMAVGNGMSRSEVAN